MELYLVLVLEQPAEINSSWTALIVTQIVRPLIADQNDRGEVHRHLTPAVLDLLEEDPTILARLLRNEVLVVDVVVLADLGHVVYVDECFEIERTLILFLRINSLEI